MKESNHILGWVDGRVWLISKRGILYCRHDERAMCLLQHELEVHRKVKVAYTITAMSALNPPLVIHTAGLCMFWLGQIFLW